MLLELSRFALQGWSLEVQKLDAVGQALLALHQGREQVGIGQIIEQFIGCTRVASTEGNVQNSLGLIGFVTTTRDGEAAQAGAGFGISGNDGIEQGRALQKGNQGRQIATS